MSKKKKLSETIDFNETTVKQFCYSEDQIFLEAQRESYPKEISPLRNNKPLPKTNNLFSSWPFQLDNLLQVRRKLDNHFYHFIQITKLFYKKNTRYQRSWYKIPTSETASLE